MPAGSLSLAGDEIKELFDWASDAGAVGAVCLVASCFTGVTFTTPLRFARRQDKSKTNKHRTTSPPMSSGSQFSLAHNL